MSNWLKYGLIWNVILLVCSIVSLVLFPDNSIDISLHKAVVPLSTGDTFHLLGTDYFGFDLFQSFINGFAISFFNALMILSCSSLIAIVFGVLSGYYGNNGFKLRRISSYSILLSLCLLAFFAFVPVVSNYPIMLVLVLLSIGIVLLDHYKIQSKPTYWSFDRWITGLYELMSSLPKFILLIALVVFFEPGWLGYILILASVTWIQKSRMIRAEVLKCKEELFIESAKALGLKDHIIIFRHIFSNIFNTIAVTWIYHLGNLFLLDASLNFIGMSGLSQHTSWGYLLAQYRYDLSAWWILLFPALGLVLFVLPLFSLSKYISQKGIENHI